MPNQHHNKNRPSFWTEERLARLNELRNFGLSFEKISRIMGCTKNQALGAWTRNIMKKKFPSDFPNKPKPVGSGKPTLAWVPGVGSNGKYKTHEASTKKELGVHE